MEYMTILTSSLIHVLSSIGGSTPPETVWFWIKGILLYYLAVHIVDSFI